MHARPEALCGRTIMVPTPLGSVFVTLNEDENGQPVEVFLNIGKCGSDVTADAEAIGRLCSLLLHLPSSVSRKERIEFMIHQLEGIGGRRDIGVANGRIRSVPDAVAHALRLYLEEQQKTS